MSTTPQPVGSSPHDPALRACRHSWTPDYRSKDVRIKVLATWQQRESRRRLGQQPRPRPCTISCASRKPVGPVGHLHLRLHMIYLMEGWPRARRSPDQADLRAASGPRRTAQTRRRIVGENAMLSDWTCTDNAFSAPSAIRLRCTAWSRAHTSAVGPPKGCPVGSHRPYSLGGVVP